MYFTLLSLCDKPTIDWQMTNYFNFCCYKLFAIFRSSPQIYIFLSLYVKYLRALIRAANHRSKVQVPLTNLYILAKVLYSWIRLVRRGISVNSFGAHNPNVGQLSVCYFSNQVPHCNTMCSYDSKLSSNSTTVRK